MKKVLSVLGTLFLVVIMCFSTVVATPVTAEAATLLDATSVTIKIDKSKTVKLKKQYQKDYYIESVSLDGDANIIGGGYDSTKMEITGAMAGKVTLVATIINSSTGKSYTQKVKVTVKGKKKADFDIVDTNGKVVNISKYFGKPMLVNFWADWCGPCMNEMPEMYEEYKEYKKKVRFLFVNVDSDSASDAKATLKKKTGGDMPAYIDYNYSASSALGISSIPRTILIDKKGYIVCDKTGSYPSASDIKSDIKTYLLKK